MMILQVILEGIVLGVLLILICAIGIRKGAVGMVRHFGSTGGDYVGIYSLKEIPI